ncbi:MAG: metallophosphoesterase [Clostridium sp.]|nr:MAG: metallophosphoesterase [Clostridium sp.]
MGTTFHAEKKFYEYLKEIEKENPDILLIAGDFVDDGTTKEDMIASCEALGKINIKYGIYFAHGNHDKGYYGEKRGYSTQDLEMELTKNNVKVLKDKSVLINNEIYIIGRKRC